jgi:hypothetical protein
MHQLAAGRRLAAASLAGGPREAGGTAMMNERVGNADREAATKLLNDALAQGYIELSEYEQRMTAVTAAHTVFELARQFGDLPAQFRWAPRSPYAPLNQPPAASGSSVPADLALAFGIAALPLALCGIGPLLGLAAVVLGIISNKRTPERRSRATIGMVLGAIGFLLGSGLLTIYVLDSGSHV